MSVKCMTSLIVSVACFAMFATGCNIDGSWMNRMSSNEIRNPGQKKSLFGVQKNNVDIKLIDISEVDLVESIAQHRKIYRDKLEKLRQYYEQHGYAQKQGWAAYELDGLRGVRRFHYLMDAEVPTQTLTATDSIEQANAMFDKGLELMKRGGHGIPAVYRKDRMIEAAEVFRNLITTYPSSDKIDDAAFFCGEIHKEYLAGQEEIAVRWYERSWMWNPDTPHPARFQAAMVYDFRMHDRDRALELYQAIAQNPAADPANARFAARRIRKLTGKVKKLTVDNSEETDEY